MNTDLEDSDLESIFSRSRDEFDSQRSQPGLGNKIQEFGEEEMDVDPLTIVHEPWSEDQ